MTDEDPVDDLHGSITMAMMSASRAAETLMRSNQAKHARQRDGLTAEAAALQQRYETQARLADQFYARASTPEFIRTEAPGTVAAAWRSAQRWRELDEARFGPHADRMTTTIREVHGLDPADADQLEDLGTGVREQTAVDADLEQQRQEDGVDREAEPGVAAGLEYDSEPARRAREEQVNQSDLHPEVKAAIKVADNQNGRDPADAARAGGRSKTGRAATRAAGRQRTPAARGR